MKKYTDRMMDCDKCNRRNIFLISVVEKNGKYYYLTQCPKCKSYDEVKVLTTYEYNKLNTSGV